MTGRARRDRWPCWPSADLGRQVRGAAVGQKCRSGLLFGLVAGPLKLVWPGANQGLAGADTSGTGRLWTLLAVGAWAIVLNQRAYQATRMSLTAPTLNITQVLVAILSGVLVPGEEVVSSTGGRWKDSRIGLTILVIRNLASPPDKHVGPRPDRDPLAARSNTDRSRRICRRPIDHASHYARSASAEPWRMTPRGGDGRPRRGEPEAGHVGPRRKQNATGALENVCCAMWGLAGPWVHGCVPGVAVLRRKHCSPMALYKRSDVGRMPPAPSIQWARGRWFSGKLG